MSVLAELQNRIQSTSALIAEHERAALEIGVQPPRSLLANIRGLEKLKRRLEVEYFSVATQPVNKKDPTRGIGDLLTSAPIKIRPIADRLGLRLFASEKLPEGASPLPVGASGMLTKDPLLAGFSGFGIVVRSGEPEARKRFTAAHEIAHYLLHSHLLKDEPIVDIAVPAAPSRQHAVPALYRSTFNSSLEKKADSLAADILMPWQLLSPLIDKRRSDIELLFKVSREAVDIRLLHPVVRRLKLGAAIEPVYESEFRQLVGKWKSESQTLPEPYRHPAYRRILRMSQGSAIPLLLGELRDHPLIAWIVALNAITEVDPTPEGGTFEQAVQAWLSWGRARGYLK